MQEPLLEFRKKYLGYKPGQLAKVRDVQMLYEFTSYPWEEGQQGGRVYIYARPIGDPTMNTMFECRRRISPVRWSEVRQKAYRQGFEDGWKYAASEARKIAQRLK